MAYSVSNDYKNKIYSGDTQNQLKLLFNNVELENADLYCEKLTVKSRIVPNGAKSFSLNNFISKEVELILHDVDLDTIQNQVTISIGTLVNNSYEYVPIGIFNIEDQPTTDKNKTTIKLRDNSVKFDFNYNAQPLIEENGGSATKLQILQDICTQAGVTCNITSFIGYLDKIGVYDNTITGRQYIANIAEQAGKIATINRNGELIFLDLNDLTTWDIPIEIVEKYENGTTYKIGKVVYEDGIVRYETPDSNDDTLFLDASNSYINGELTKEQSNSTTNTFELSNTSENDLVDLTIDGKASQPTRTGKNLWQNTNYYASVPTANYTITATGFVFNRGSLTGGKYIAKAIAVQSGKAYTFSANISANPSSDCYIAIYRGNVYGTLLASSYSGVISITATANEQLYFTFIVNSGLTSATVYDIQVEQNSIRTGYEPYGKSPTPDFPSKIKNVGYQNLTSLNNFTNNVTSVYYVDRKLLDNFKNFTTYTLSFDITSTVTPFRVSVGYGNNSFQADMTGGTLSDQYNGHITITFTTNNTTYSNLWIRIPRYTSATTYQTSVSNMILVEGYKEHSYIPYGKYGIDFEFQNKNLFKITQSSGTYNELTFTKIDNNTFRVQGTTGSSARSIALTSLFPTITENEKYTYSCEVVSGTFVGTLPIAIYNSDNTVRYNYFMLDTTNLSQTNTIIANNGIQGIAYYIGANSTVDVTLKIMFEKSPIKTEYIEYANTNYTFILDNPLRAIGDVKDKLYIENGTLKVERNIRHFELPISEMNNSEEYPGWTNRTETAQLKQDYPNKNTTFASGRINYLSNIRIESFSADYFALNTNGNGVIFLPKSTNDNLNQTQWNTNYPNLVVDFDYVMPETEIEIVGDVTIPTTYNGKTYIDINSRLNTNIHIEYKQNTTQLEAILNEVDEFSIDSLKTGKILGNPAIDPYDLIHIHEISKNLYVNSQDFSGAWQNSSAWETATETFNNCVVKKRKGAWQGIYKAYTVTEGKTYTFSLYGKADNTKRCSIYLTPNGMSDVTEPKAKYNVDLQPYWQRFYITFVATATGYIAPRIEAGTSNDDYIYIACYQLEESEYTTDYEPYYDKEFTTLATNELTYTGVITNTFDTQIGEEQKEQNVTINGEATFKKWATTKIDNVEGEILIQAGEIDDTNGRIDSTEFTINKQGALLNVISTNSDININYDESGNPLNGEITAVKTKQKGFTFNDDGLTISAGENDFKSVSNETGTYYYDGANPTGEYTKDGSKQQNLTLFGAYKYGMDDYEDTPMFVAQLYTDNTVTPAEQGVGHFYNGDLNNGGGE